MPSPPPASPKDSEEIILDANEAVEAEDPTVKTDEEQGNAVEETGLATPPLDMDIESAVNLIVSTHP